MLLRLGDENGRLCVKLTGKQVRISARRGGYEFRGSYSATEGKGNRLKDARRAVGARQGRGFRAFRRAAEIHLRWRLGQPDLRR